MYIVSGIVFKIPTKFYVALKYECILKIQMFINFLELLATYNSLMIKNLLLTYQTYPKLVYLFKYEILTKILYKILCTIFYIYTQYNLIDLPNFFILSIQ